MNAKELLSKYKSIIIMILLFSLVFSLRAQAAYLPDLPGDIKPIYQDQNGYPYFSEMDSYYNYRLTQDYLDHGYLGDTIINGTQWDTHSNYPYGRNAEYPPLIAYITASVYKFVNLFGNVPLNAVAIWLSPFIASLCVIPAYLFIKRYTNDYGGIVAGILAGTAPAYFLHTFAGFFDTDMFNVLFPILIVWFFVESIQANNIKNRSIFIILSTISMLLFSRAWEGWWYIFYLIIGTGIVYILVSYLFPIKTKPFKEYPDKFKWFLDQPALFSLIVFVIASAILIIIFSNSSYFFGQLTSFIGYSNLQSLVSNTNYPNVYISVSELQIPSIIDIFKEAGGVVAVLTGILVIPLLIWKLKPQPVKNASKKNRSPKLKSKPRRRAKRNKIEVLKEKEEKIKTNTAIDSNMLENKKNYLLYVVLFVLWFLITGYMMTKGSRFIEAFSIPVSLGAGLFIGLIAPQVKEYVNNSGYNSLITFFTVFIIAFSFLFIIMQYTLQNAIVVGIVTGITAGWGIKYLKKIEYKNTLAIILIISAVVIWPLSICYATPIVPGTDDYMVNSVDWVKNSTSNNTIITSWWDYGYLFEAVGDRSVTFDGGSQNTARAYWIGKALFTSDENLSAGILGMLTYSGDNGYLAVENITKNSGKSVAILDKILPVNKQQAQVILINDYHLSTDQAQSILKYTHPDNPAPYVFITSSDMLGKSGWWSYMGSWDFNTGKGKNYVYSASQASPQQVNGSTVLVAGNGVITQMNGSQITAGLQYRQNNQTQIIPAHKLTVIQNNRLVMSQIISNESPISIILIMDNSTNLAIAMNKELEDSMFTKLFIFKGNGLSKFKLAHEEPGVDVWNVS